MKQCKQNIKIPYIKGQREYKRKWCTLMIIILMVFAYGRVVTENDGQFVTEIFRNTVAQCFD